tara:strand:+ start:273 stop:626 length:354 start_codon:yes stop_codon:yes gene_type:complete
MSYKTFDGTAQTFSVNKSNTPTVETLGTPTGKHQLTAASTSASTDLTANITRISIYCRSNDARYEIGTTAAALTASASTSHFIAKDERLDIKVPLNGRIAYIRDASADATLEITELA